jgi:DNA-binding NtrC family response regulator
VEDEESLRLMSSRHLNQYGYHVITASNGREALDIYPKEGKSISLIILDLVMPVMDGRKCLEKILRINPNAKVIIASGVTEEGSTNVAQVKGAKGSIRKPYDIKRMLRMVREVLDKD